MTFDQKLIYLGVENKDRNEKDAAGKWVKTGEMYQIARFFDTEGTVVEIRLRDVLDQAKIAGLIALQQVDAKLKLTCGKYINIDIVSIAPVKVK